MAVMCVGELLWDVLPAGRHLGGAPLNVAAHLARLGVPSGLITRVGDDPAGAQALAIAAGHGIDMTYTQTDPQRPTGEAVASLDAAGSARYRFTDPAAWDAIECSAGAVAACGAAQAVVFGTLAQRSMPSRATVQALVAAAPWRVFDANLREPHVDRELTMASLRLADLVKLNEYECATLVAWLGCGEDRDHLRAAIAAIRNRPEDVPLELCITRGEHGAWFFSQGQWHEAVASPTEVADTVGAGDAFLAMLIASRLGGGTPLAALQRATVLAAFVASQPGAVPEYDARRLELVAQTQHC
jgi:fructokinase